MPLKYSLNMVNIDGCYFPDNLKYDEDLKLWFKIDNLKLTLGITSVYSWYIGKINKIRYVRNKGLLEENKNLCIIESIKRIEPIRLPFMVEILSINEDIIENPKLLNNYNYEKGWIAIVRPVQPDYLNFLYDLNQLKVEEKVKNMQTKCFKMIPDITLYEIGTECAAVITKLNEMMNKLSTDSVVMLVSDDPTAYVEIIRWTDQTKNVLVDYRKEKEIWYFILKKA